MSVRRYKTPNTLGFRNLGILPFLLLLLLASCGDVEDDYYPSVHSIRVSVGKDHIDVIIRGSVRNIGDFVSDVKVIKFRDEIILIPIARPSSSRESLPAEDPFERTIRIDGLERRSYTITVIGQNKDTEGRTVVTEIVKVK